MYGWIDISYIVTTTAFEGTVSTPFFKQPFDENTFQNHLNFMIYINVPESIQQNKNMSLVINVDYDLGEVGNSEYMKMSKNPKFLKNEEIISRTYNVTEDEDSPFLVRYMRVMNEDQLTSWKSKRNTGMKVTWYYTSIENNGLLDNKHVSDNK